MSTASSPIGFELFAFEALPRTLLYEALALRARVFVVEQRCAYLDLDGKDAAAQHLLGRAGGALVAYARILPPGVSFPEHSIGRIVTAPEVRGRGVGSELVRCALAHIVARAGPVPVALAAQAHLVRFYESLGFRQTSEPYLEDEIPHVDMRRDRDA